LAVLDDNQTGYWPDYAAEIDREEETLADELGVTVEQAQAFLRIRDAALKRQTALKVGAVISVIIQSENKTLMLHSLAIAAGLDGLNGYHSEQEIADEFNVTRSLVSHYVVGWRDFLSGKNMRGFDNMKFRKKNEVRSKYAEQATDPFLEAKRRVLAKIREHNARKK
jgi:predicted transcriptional regulator